MKNKLKSWIMLFVFSLSLVPFRAGQAEIPDRTFAEARYLLYLGDAFLEEEANLDTAVNFPELMALAPGVQRAEGAKEVMDRMIHAAKQERNDLDANCRELKRRYQSAGDQEAVQKLAAYCEGEHQRLTDRIKFLRKLRGDRRKLFTRWWHSIKRSSANLWRRIGPLGRNILRKVGDEAFNTVVSGGSLNVGRLVKHTAKSVMRGKLKSVMYDGVARLLESQLDIARAAGVLENGEEAGDGDVDSLLDSLEEVSDQEDQVTEENSAGEQSSCQPGEPWLVDYWEETIVPLLKQDGKSCFSSDAYYSCLQKQESSGICPLDAFVACEDIYQQILPMEGGGMVKITDNAVYHRDSDNYFEMSFPVRGGAVSGYAAVDYVEDKGGGDQCGVSFTFTFTGTFNPATCQLQGTGIKTLSLEESRSHICVGYPEPYDDRIENWSMTINNGLLNISSPPDGFPISGLYGVMNNLH